MYRDETDQASEVRSLQWCNPEYDRGMAILEDRLLDYFDLAIFTLL